jgi:hypothetical protein
MEMISWTDRVKGEEILHGIKKERNILFTRTGQRRKPKWIGHITLRNCPLEHIIEGKIEGTRRQGRSCKQLLGDFKDKRK